ncbi:MBL fold metallo-hydrolase [Candidatus Wolfebacteria bacterium]|nr:MBL fold metallo-hydrolase [Candidatus Wolfebacteria bacterium]
MFNRNLSILIFIFLSVFDFFVWHSVVAGKPNKNLEVYFLNVGQGDSQLAILPGGVKVLIDGGPNNKVISELSSIFQPTDRYIDLAVMSHPQYDHFAGLIDVLKRYEVGAFIYNGRRGEIKAFDELENVLKEKNVNKIILVQGDKIKYGGSRFDILSPDNNFLQSKELNDTCLVMGLTAENNGNGKLLKVLFTGDIGANIEKYLADNFDINVDVLKVAHHGSKYSSSEEFLKKARPKISVIEVGKNTYGHPTKKALDNLASIGSQIFRTDQNDTLKLVFDGGKINVFKK